MRLNMRSAQSRFTLDAKSENLLNVYSISFVNKLPVSICEGFSCAEEGFARLMRIAIRARVMHTRATYSSSLYINPMKIMVYPAQYIESEPLSCLYILNLYKSIERAWIAHGKKAEREDRADEVNIRLFISDSLKTDERSLSVFSHSHSAFSLFS